MASPLSPAQDAALNLSTPATARRYDKYEVEALTLQSETPNEGPNSSSPFVSTVNDTVHPDQENPSPSKSRHSRVLSGTELSPLKILADQRASVASLAPDKMVQPLRSPRKLSPEKRFPVKPSNPIETPRPTHQRTMSLEDVVMENEGLKRAIAIFEDEQSVMEDVDEDDEHDATMNVDAAAQMELDPDESSYPDDTMASTFSTFSVIPNMTMFAKLGQSPTKLSMTGGLTPRGPRPDPSPSRTPRPTSVYEAGNTTNLLDFTEQMRFPHKASTQRSNISPSRTAPNVAATPSRQFANLIDFDIPPMPTPRSVPSITPRELESLKSNFLSEISSLKASLSGKEAEVQSLKTAVGDAEKRVGESLEQIREEKSQKEQLTVEKEGWENRGREMENVLRKVKEEIVLSQREREELEQKLEESEKRREAAEIMHQEAESKMAGMRAGKDSDKTSPERVRSPSSSSNHEVEIAVERVARELHALYKSKHETKVAALKKSYESRWEKKVRELESRIDEMADENERLRLGRDATMTRVDPGTAEAEERKAQAVRDSAAIKELNADIQRLEAVVQTVQQDNEGLRGMLEKERVEKGELVQLAEEMMSMQSIVGPSQSQPLPEKPEAKTPKKTMETMRSSISRSSGLRAPGSGLRAPHERTKSAGLPRPGGIARSGIMSSIEKMGSYRGRVME